MDRRLGWRIERMILLVLIILSILDFANLLNAFFAYVLDLVSWTTIAYIIYAVSPTELFFGERHAHCDLFVVLAYAVMSVKDLIANAAATLVGLVQQAPSYISFAASTATAGKPYLVNAAEFNSIALKILPHQTEIARAVAPHLSFAQQEFTIILTDGTRQAAFTAYPTGLSGTMLLFYNTLVQNAVLIETVSLLLGMLILIIVAIYASYNVPIKKPSILSVLKEEGAPTLLRPMWVFLLLIGFFVIVFNLLFEWMTITNDLPLLVLMSIILLILYLIHHDFSLDSFVENVSNLSLQFYQKCIELFMDARTILLGISGFLVLHLITDVGNFVAPAIFGWYQTLYMLHAPGEHLSLAAMLTSSLQGTWLQNTLLGLAYGLSVIGLVLLLAMPALIWYKIFKIRTTQSHEHLPNWRGWHVGLVLACMIFALLVPVFAISSITQGELVGVNLTSNPVTLERLPAVASALWIAAGILVFCTIFGLLHDYVRRILMLGPILVSIIFFGIYIYSYFTSIFTYYAQLLVNLLQNATLGSYAVLPMLFVTFSFTIIFFITGFFSFLYEIWRD